MKLFLSKPDSLIFSWFFLLLIASISFSACKEKKSDPVPSPVVEEDHPCPPVNITELYKLELLKADYDALKAINPPPNGLTFQFVYERNAINKMTMVAYATKPGRGFQPPVLKYLQPIQVAAIVLPDIVSMGDQFAKFAGPAGLDQLLTNSGHATNFYSLTFTPVIYQTAYNPSPGVTAYVQNIKFNICVKYLDATGQFIEYCGAAPSSTHPSPPADY